MDETTSNDTREFADERLIVSRDDLRTHLQWAIELEHATLPPYLCALYSLDPARNPQAVEVVQSVFVEEMLHLTLAANLLNAIGGSPVLDAPHLLPGYPRTLPHGAPALTVELQPFGPEALEGFLRIEHPSPPRAAREADRYETIGQFYSAIEAGLRYLCDALGEEKLFTGDPSRQVGSTYPYGGSGKVVAVTDLDTAIEALREIVEQGEGTSHTEVWDGDHQMFHADRNEVAHYYRFEELKLGRQYQAGDTRESGPTGKPVDVDWQAVHPMRPNQRIGDPGSPEEVRQAQQRFNDAYCTLLWMLEQTFNGEPSTLGPATGAMFGLRAQAQALLQMPVGDGLTAGPTFEYVAPQDRS
ncbi:ferritin-like protein [Nocardioides conyzicola]|uniref:Ferritin-like protein n=1 Tax=Nocardioides conyzicola TaxID=1651781 RepID=A0ABP8Y2Q9_9ACTN